jgi:SAM-dependent methyltransferase
VTEETALLLNTLLPDFYWFREGHSFSDGSLRVRGAVVHSQNLSHENFRALVDGHSVNWTGPLPSPYADENFWFVAPERRFGVLIDEPVADARPRMVVCFAPETTTPARMAEFSFVQFRDWELFEPTPPVENIERVSGRGATAYNYYNNGATDLLRLTSIANRHGVRLKRSTRVLDWGCGCGRLTRYLLPMTDVVGIDVDADNVDWCRQNLDPDAFQVVSLLPPTGLAEATFDLVIANSVLSHLRRDALHSWLAEIKRLLAPDGVALLSYHGDFSLCSFASRSRELVSSVLETGLDDSRRAPELDSVIEDNTYYRHTFMTDQEARSIFSRYLAVEEQVTGVVSRFQNVAVLRKS